MTFEPVKRMPLAEAIFRQIRDAIVRGEFKPGEKLPSERRLSQSLAANRGAIREALKRLEQSRLIEINQGGSTRVLDYHRTATLELVSQLLCRRPGEIDMKVARSMIELRVVISADLARLAALRGGQPLADELGAILAALRDHRGDGARLLDLTEDFWATLARYSENIAYVLILNSIREVSEVSRDLLGDTIGEQLSDLSHFERILRAVEEGDAQAAECAARERAQRIAQALEGTGTEPSAD